MSQQRGVVDTSTMWVLLHLPATTFLTERPANGLETAGEDGPSIWGPVNYLGNPDETPGSSLVQPWPLQPCVE